MKSKHNERGKSKKKKMSRKFDTRMIVNIEHIMAGNLSSTVQE